MEGWIKLHRKLVDWEWYDEPNTKIVFIDLLLNANHKEGSWRGEKIPRGGLVTSVNSIAERNKLSIKQVRTALSHLQKTGEIGKQRANGNTLIIVLNYERYQDFCECDKSEKGKSEANEGQTEGKSGATNKNDKNVKNEKNVRRESNAHTKKSYGVYGNVLLTDSECQTLDKDFGNTEQLIKRLDEYKEQTGKKYKSDYLAIRRWVVKAVKEDEAKEQGIDTTYDISDINNRAMLNDEFDI